MPESKSTIQIPPIIQVRELAALLEIPVTKLITELVKNGVMATINESLDYDTAAIIADELGFKAEPEIAVAPKISKKSHKRERLDPRPPVVTIMGHVDHGKTKLLDAIRETNVVATESGGITQHIGAYQAQVQLKDKKKHLITFIDTPGHEAFAAMRVHGVKVTDLMVLVIAADDGVKPQTLEAISHIRAANVPVIVAMNKIDKPEADPERVLRQIAQAGLQPEEWGGKVPTVKISALKKIGIGELLELIILAANLLELKASSTSLAEGVVIEAKLKTGIGPVATVLVQSGTLRPADVLIIGNNWCRVRTLHDFRGQKIKEAPPSTPVQISGLKSVPQAGDFVRQIETEKEAKSILAQEAKKNYVHRLSSQEIERLTEVKLILKADAGGSLDAIVNSLVDIANKEVAVKIVSSGIGAISESDINMAQATGSKVIGFKVDASPVITKLAFEKGVKIARYEVIYELLDEIKTNLEALLEPERSEVPVGKLKVIRVFRRSNRGGLFGGEVIEGQAETNTHFRVKRGDDLIGESKIESLQQDRKPKESIAKGFEAGIIYNGSLKIKPDDMVEMFYVQEKKREL